MPVDTSLYPRANQQPVNTLAQSFDPLGVTMGIASIANMMDQRKGREIQNKIANMNLANAEEANDYAMARAALPPPKPGEPAVRDSYGPLSVADAERLSRLYPKAWGKEKQVVNAYLLKIEEERRKALATVAGHGAAVDPELAMREVKNIYGQAPGQATTPTVNVAAPPAPIAPATPGEVGDVQQRAAFIKGGGHLPAAAPVNMMAAITPEERGALQQGAPLPPAPVAQAPATGQAEAPTKVQQIEAYLNAITNSSDPVETKLTKLDQAFTMPGMPPALKSRIAAMATILSGQAQREKEPAGTESNYRQGLEKQLKEQHFKGGKWAPGWSQDRVQFEAAKQVRDENAKAAKEKLELNVSLQQGGPQEMFKTWTPEQKETWFQMTEADRQTRPNFGYRDMQSRRQYDHEFAQWLIDKKQTGRETVVGQREFKADSAALQKLTEIEQRVESYNIRIKETSNKVLIPLIKKWDLQNPRFANWPVNKLAEVMGSGDLASLKLALNSVSNEVGKVEYNALGIQQLSDTASKFMSSIHDPNMKVSELLKVVDTSKALGQTGNDALNKQREALKRRMGGKKTPASDQATPPGGTSWETLKKAKGW